MRRSRGKKKAIGVSLFPFLAVLICTMGALIVLLVLVVKRASVYAQEQQHQVASQWEEEQELLRQQQETDEFKQSTLAKLRPQLTQQLADHRKELGHLESHIRDLQQQLARLNAEFDDLSNVDTARDRDLTNDQLKLAQLQQQIAKKELELDAARRRAANKRRSFAVVPYQGRNGTRRRPIFIECTHDRVILQPEGIELGPSDFQHPLPPGNPLDAALLAVRDYLLDHGGVAAHGEPYPLLICRSNGTLSYNKARAAMRSWDDEFGYELIDETYNLAYPKADPELAKILRQIVEQARRRQKMLARAQPSRFQDGVGSGDGDGRVTLRASPTHGGFVVEREAEDGAGLLERSANDSAGFGGAKKPDALQTPQQPQQSQPSPTATNGQRQPAGTPQSPASGMPMSIAQAKGSDWALPSRSHGATPFHRPIIIVCFPNELVIVPQRGTSQRTQTVPFSGATREAVQPFVAAIWQHMESWGIAGRNVYWKPELHIQVAPGAEQRLNELRALMANSGFDFAENQ